jgi:hypothetical protein
LTDRPVLASERQVSRNRGAWPSAHVGEEAAKALPVGLLEELRQSRADRPSSLYPSTRSTEGGDTEP